MLFRRKLPRASLVLVAISIVCALAATLVMRAYARRIDAVRPDGGPPIGVVAATEDIERGAVLDEQTLEVVTVPSRFAPPGAIRDLTRATGKIVVADIAAGEVVTRWRLAGTDAGPTASLVPPGMRAVQIPVVRAVGVRPGDVVDVIATFGGGGAHTEVAGEALEVLSVERGGGIALTLLVTPTDAETLAFATAFATLSIAVRGPDDVVPGEAFTVPVTSGG